MRWSTWVLVEELRRATDAELHCWSLQELKDKTERDRESFAGYLTICACDVREVFKDSFLLFYWSTKRQSLFSWMFL